MTDRPRRLFPKTLFGQTVLVLLAGLVVSHLAGIWILTADRASAVRALGAFTTIQRIANLARLVDEAPADWRERLVAAASDRTLGMALSAQPPAWTAGGKGNTTAAALHAILAHQLPAGLAGGLRVALDRASREAPPGPADPMMSMMGMKMMGVAAQVPIIAGRGLRAAIRLSDGQWLSFEASLPEEDPALSWPFVIALSVMAIVVVPVSVWAVRRITVPLGTLAAAAERLGHDVAAPPVAEAGSLEMRRAACAFNEMQARLRQLVENRTRMLAGLSHDLRTPLTLLRLRAENVPDAEDRERMLATIAAMNEMIEATLDFARNEAAAEPPRRTDVAALLAAIADDMAEAGLPVTMVPAAAIELTCRPAALRRALGNLLDNAVKYGGAAEVAIVPEPQAVAITIDDRGPGIPEAEFDRVFQPFYRLEESRSRETGGSGLGLALARAIVEAHGGAITLANRAGGGLSVRVTLPR
jgi:signal transduction histidine kinase